MALSQRACLSFVAVAAAVASVSCTASLDLDRFRKQEGGINVIDPTVTHLDMLYRARSMQSHLNQFLELRIVTPTNQIVAKAVYNEVVEPDFTIYMPRAVPRQSAGHRFDWWADHTLNGTYDGVVGGINDADHAWRRFFIEDDDTDDIDLVDGVWQLVFNHNTTFTDIYTDAEGNPIEGEDGLVSGLLPFKLDFKNAEPYLDRPIEVRVIEKGERRLVALHRQGRAKLEYTAEVTGVLDSGTDYEVSVYADLNGDFKYTTDEPSWKLDVTSTRDGVVQVFDLAIAPSAEIEQTEFDKTPNE